MLILASMNPYNPLFVMSYAKGYMLTGFRMSFNPNGNRMGFYGQPGNGNSNGTNGQNAAFNNAAFANGAQGQSPQQRQLTPQQMALLAQQQRQNGMMQQQQALQQQQRPMQNPPTLNPQLVQQMMAQQQQRAQQAATPAPPSRPPAQPVQPVQQLSQLEGAMAAIIPRLPVQLQQRIASGQLTAAQQQSVVTSYVQAQTRERLAQARSSPQPGQVRPAAQTQLSTPNMQTTTQTAQRTQQPSQLQGRPAFPHASSSPATSTQGLPARTQTPPPAAYHPSVLSTPPQAGSVARMPSPPRAEGRRGSSSVLPAHDSSSIDNPALAAAIPAITPTNFQLDQSRLRLPNRPQSANSSASSSSIVNTSLPTTVGNEAAYGNSVLLPAQRKRPQLPSVAFLPTGTRERSPVRERGEERRRGNEGMRGSMRNERKSGAWQSIIPTLILVAKLMWAAGDVPEPDTNAVDYMEDLVVDFLADLCRPVPPIRSNPGAPRQPVPLSTGIVRDRLATKPAYKKYLNRFDTMSYLEGEIKKSRKSFANPETNFDDIIDTVGKDYLEIDVVGPAQSQPGAPKRKGRPTKKSLLPDGATVVKAEGTATGAEGGEDGEAPSARRKPGPKKGWKRTLPTAVDGEAPQPQQASYGSDGRKIKRPNKKRKKEDGTEGGVAVSAGSPAAR